MSKCDATSSISSRRSTAALIGVCSSATAPRLWTNLRETIEAFLCNEWVSSKLLGSTPKEAFFVRCDRSTMTHLDNGRLICHIGVAALKPAEFVIVRISQKTADART